MTGSTARRSSPVRTAALLTSPSPVTATGTARFDIGVRRGNVWHFDTDFDGVADETFAYGRSTDYPLMGDWDGDGDFTPGIVAGTSGS